MANHQRLSIVPDASGGAERRHGARNRVLLSATLVTTTQEQPVRIRDISSRGVLIEGQGLPLEGRDLIIRRGGIEIFSRIAWADGDRCGVEFDDELSERELVSFAQRPLRIDASPPQPRFSRPGLKANILTPDQMALARSWGRPGARRDAPGE